MQPLLHHRSCCRLCDSPEVARVLELAPCPLTDDFLPQSRLHESQERFPVDLYLCRACGHGQLLDVVSPRLLFGHYAKSTAQVPGLTEYFRHYADHVTRRLRLRPGARALDVGSNDGTLLRFLSLHQLRVLGVDPARDIASTATAAGIETLPDFFTASVANEILNDRGPFHLITANDSFAHADDLSDMADGIRLLLAPDGVFVCEVRYLLDLVRNMFFDALHHEHLSHHSVKPLQRFLHRHGLHLFDVEHSPGRGGSIRCFIQLLGGPHTESPAVQRWIHTEDDFGLHHPDTYRQFSERIRLAGLALRAALDPIHARNGLIAGYGAAATCTLLAFHYELGPYLRFIIDDHPRHQNLFTPGHHLPILPGSALASERPDAVVILAWRLADPIIQRNRAYLDAGGRFIVPLPSLKIV